MNDTKLSNKKSSSSCSDITLVDENSLFMPQVVTSRRHSSMSLDVNSAKLKTRDASLSSSNIDGADEELSTWQRKFPKTAWNAECASTENLSQFSEIVDMFRKCSVFSEESLSRLKADSCSSKVNPSYVMDLRHLEATRRSLLQQKTDLRVNNQWNVMAEARRFILMEQLDRMSKVKEACLVAKEIEKFKIRLQASRDVKDKSPKKYCSIKCERNVHLTSNTSNIVATSTMSQSNDIHVNSWTNPSCEKYVSEDLTKESAQFDNVEWFNHVNNSCPDDMLCYDGVAKSSQPEVYEPNEDFACGEHFYLNQLFNHKLLHKYFSKWKMSIHCETSISESSSAPSESDTLLQACWQKWRKYVTRRKLKSVTCQLKVKLTLLEKKHEKAMTFYKRRLFRNSWETWRNFVLECQRRKQLLEETSLRKDKIDCFLKFLEQRKKEIEDVKQKQDSSQDNVKVVNSSVKGTPTKNLNGARYENRFQMQKDIIEKQKEKLKEQTKLIEELTMSKLQTEMELSANEMSSLLTDVLPHCSSSLKQKVRQFKTTTSRHAVNVTENSESSFTSKVNFQPMPPPAFVQRIEERAAERAARRKYIMEKKIKEEEERKMKLQKEEEEKQRKEEEDKKKRIAEIMEKRRQEQEIQRLKMIEQEKWCGLMRKAADHYKKHLLRKFGIRPFKKLLDVRKVCMKKGEQHFSATLIRRTFILWRTAVQIILQEKLNIALNFHNTHLLQKYLFLWIQFYISNKKQYQVAEDWHDLRLQERVFVAWCQFSWCAQRESAVQLGKAENHYNRLIMASCFCVWRKLPSVMQGEREKERRKEIWRHKVQEVLPDFRPAVSTE